MKAISLVISVALGAMAAQARGIPREERDRDATVSDRIGPALEKRIRGRASLDDVRVEVNWPLESGLSSVRVYGSGVGIWDRKVQFRLSKTQVVSILTTLQKGRFASLPERFGESEEDEREKEKKDKNEGPRLKGRIEIRAGSIAKTASQMMDGEQSEELDSLAKRILAICQGPARTGVGAASLADGLEKVVSRVLEPEMLQVTVQRRADASKGGTPGGAWVLRLEGRQVFDELLPGAQPRKVLVLSEADFQSLVKQLADHHPETIPINVFAPEYTDLQLGIFRWSRSVSARRFLGMTPQTKGEAQKSFDEIFETFRALHERARKEGTTVPSTPKKA